MRDRILQSADGRGQRVRLRASATVAAGTFALGMTFVLPAIAVAHTSIRHGGADHRIALHAARFSSHEHHTYLSYPADLTPFSADPEWSFEPVSAASAGHPHERVTPTA